jgi:hypothetical protein
MSEQQPSGLTTDRASLERLKKAFLNQEVTYKSTSINNNKEVHELVGDSRSNGNSDDLNATR